MKKSFALMFCLLFVTGAAFANEELTQSNDEAMTAQQRKIPEACKKAAVDATEKTAIRAAILQEKKDSAELEAQLKIARLNAKSAFEDSAANFASAQTASAAVVDAFSKLAVERSTLRNDILFNILKPEQRAPFMECRMILKRMARKHRRHHQQKGAEQTAPQAGAQDVDMTADQAVVDLE